jgi:hypothetical protein
MKQIGRYRVIDRLGKGAMGIVYRAHDDQMDREVALKVMMGDLEAEPETRARFYREAKVTSQLLHRNIVTIFDLGEEDGRLYIVMELLRGETLSEFLKKPTAQSIEQKLDLMIQIGEGLSVAHAKGVFHRDIKPANMLVMPDGSLKILDFGVARLANSTMTASGFIVGTPDYMSPEQAQGREVDARSDIFSAAGVFYFILTGRKPFEAADLPAVLNRVIREAPTPLREVESPPALTRILMKALSKDPANRYQTCHELLADLTRCKRQFDAETRRLTAAACERYGAVMALIQEAGRYQSALETVAARLAENAERLEARYPMLAHPDNELKVGGFQRARIAEITADLQAQHDRLSAILVAMRTICVDDAELTAAAAAAPGAAGQTAAVVAQPEVAVASLHLVELRRDDAPRTVMASVGGWASTMLRRLGSSRGQTTTEWLMIAGVLSAVSAFILGIVPGALSVFVRSLAAGIRTVAP